MAALGPDDLGRRVVVRYRTGGIGPSGGPELTDVIGHVRALDDATVTVRRRDGELVSVPWAEVVACKVVS